MKVCVYISSIVLLSCNGFLVKNLYLCLMKKVQTIRNTIRMQSKNSENAIFLLVQGAFYHAFNEGAEHLHSVMGYRIRVRNEYKLLGFPISSLGCVLQRIHAFYNGNKVVEVQASNYPHLIINISDK